MARAPRLGKFKWKISYIPYIGAVDPGTGERFGAEWGTHESFFENESAARQRFTELLVPDVIEHAELSEIVPQPRGGWALRFVDEWRDQTARAQNDGFLYGREIRRVAKSVLEEFPGLKMGRYAQWKKEDGSFSYDVDRPHSTRAITFGWIVAGDFYAVPMEDEYRGESYDVRDVHSERELADFIRDVVLAEADWLGLDVSGHQSKHPRLRPLSEDESRKHNLVAIPPRRA